MGVIKKMQRRSSILGDEIAPPTAFPTIPPHPPTPPPPADAPSAAPVMTPLVYVQEKVTWEYKIMARETEPGDPSDEAELNALGAESWEMVGVVCKPDITIYYFKRLKP